LNLFEISDHLFPVGSEILVLQN